MINKTTKKVILITICIFLCIICGIFTAPIGIPFIVSAETKQALDLSIVPAIYGKGDIIGNLQTYIFNLLASPTGMQNLALWCALVLIVIGCIVVVNLNNQPSRNVDEGILGNSILIKAMSEIRQRNDFWNGRGEPKNAGLVLGNSRRGYIYDSSVPHFAVVGKTGSGKSWFMVLQTLHLCMARKWNLIVTGKEELLELTGNKALELGYHRVIFDLKGYPQASRFNPLDLIAEYAETNRIDLAQKTARQTATDLIPLGGETNTYFPKAARSALSACLLIVAMADIPREQKNMTSVCNLINHGTTGEGSDPSAPLKDFIRSDAIGPTHPAYAPAADFLSDGGLTTAGKNVLSTLKEALSIFNDAGIAYITAKSDISIRRMIQEKTIIYMHLLEEGDPYMVLMTVFLNQWWRIAQDEARQNGGRLSHETAIIGDEWGNLPAVSAMPEIVTLGRSFRLHAWCFTQDLKQWHKYNKPGDQNAGRDKILGSMGGKVALSLANPEDFQYFTRLVGKHTIRTHNMATSKNSRGTNTSHNSSETYAERADDLIHEWEWQNRVPIRDGLIVIKGAENSKPGREGVFQMPVTYASKTPAGKFFGLGSEDQCDTKRIAFRKQMEANSAFNNDPISYWHIDFEKYKSNSTIKDEVEQDEFSAWDGLS